MLKAPAFPGRCCSTVVALACLLLTRPALADPVPCVYSAAPTLQLEMATDPILHVPVVGYHLTVNCLATPTGCDEGGPSIGGSVVGTHDADPDAGTVIGGTFADGPGVLANLTQGFSGVFQPEELTGTKFTLVGSTLCGSVFRGTVSPKVFLAELSTPPVVPPTPTLCSFTRPQDIELYGSREVSCAEIPVNTPVRIQASFYASPRNYERLSVHLNGAGVAWKRDYGYDAEHGLEAGGQFFGDPGAVFTFTQTGTARLWISFGALEAVNDIGLIVVDAADAGTPDPGAVDQGTGPDTSNPASCSSTSGLEGAAVVALMGWLRRRRP